MVPSTAVVGRAFAVLTRWIAILGLTIVGLLAVGAVTLYLAYGISQAPPRRAALAGLDAPVTIAWHDAGYASVTGETEGDRYAALGFVHGSQFTWNVVLWRQAGLGRLAEWFGPSALPIDRFMHTLGIAAAARLAFGRLEEEERALLSSYGSGLEAALRTRGSVLNREISLLGVQPEPWEPWHALVVERLFAWLSVSEQSIRVASQPAPIEVGRFLEGNRTLRQFLHLHGFGESAAWTVVDSSGSVLAQRHVLGASALPVFAEVMFVTGDSALLAGASIPGTPFFPAGKTREGAWSILMNTRVGWVKAAAASVAVDTAFSRITLRRGDELLVRTPRTAESLAFLEAATRQARPDTTLGGESVPAPRDSLWLLPWAGLTFESDAAAWRGLLNDSAGTFSLTDNNGIILQRNGSVHVLGEPLVSRPTTSGHFVGNGDWSEYLALRLDSLGASEDEAAAAPFLDDCSSAWAAQLAPGLVDAVDVESRDVRLLAEALTYLRNWDFSYDRTSIGAAVFDTWLRTHLDSAGALPTHVATDTSRLTRVHLHISLRHAVNRLARDFGPQPSEWRWEAVAPAERFYPVWSADTFPQVDHSILPATRYAPIVFAAQGHPSSPCWGPSPIQRVEPAPDHWEAWISTDDWQEMKIRRRALDQEALLARYRISSQRPPPVSMSTMGRFKRQTLLVPHRGATQ